MFVCGTWKPDPHRLEHHLWDLGEELWLLHQGVLEEPIKQIVSVDLLLLPWGHCPTIAVSTRDELATHRPSSVRTTACLTTSEALPGASDFGMPSS